ncbi:hypothetical protein BCT81_07425 [Vibrio sp. 10N.261.52.A1]|nr:hypothetical protein BCT81_07425 [Vibrio sp. 10N.261.52.A1]
MVIGDLLYHIWVLGWMRTAPAILVWIKNPHETTSWKIWAVMYSFALGPIGFLSIKNWEMK